MRTHDDGQFVLIIILSSLLTLATTTRTSVHKSRKPTLLPAIDLPNSSVSVKSQSEDFERETAISSDNEEDLPEEPADHHSHRISRDRHFRPEFNEAEMIQREERNLRVVNPDVESAMDPSQEPPVQAAPPPPPFDAKASSSSTSGDRGLRTEFVPIGGGRGPRRNDKDDVQLQIQLKLGPHLIPALEYGKSL